MPSINYSQRIKIPSAEYLLAYFLMIPSLFRKFFLVGGLLLIGLNANAQNKTPQQRLDSLLTVYQNHPKEDSIKLVIMKQVYKAYMRLRNYEKIDQYIDRSIVLGNKINQKKYAADAYYNRALFYQGLINYEKAINNYNKAIPIYQDIDDLDMVAGSYLNMGALYFTIPDYAKALEVNQKAIAIYEKNGNEIDMASSFTNIASLYQELGDHANALKYLKKALLIFAKDGENNRGVIVVYNTIGSTYFNATDTELVKMGVNPLQRNNIALENLNKALKIAQETNEKGVFGTLYKDLGSVYEEMGKKDLALQAYQKSILFHQQEEDKIGYAFAQMAIADFYANENENEKAKTALLAALKIGQDNKLLEIQRNANLKLSQIEEKQGHFIQSLAYYKQYILFKDQIFSEEKEKEITRRQLQIDFGIKERDYQLKQKITDGDLQRQVLLARQQQQQLIVRQQQLDLSDKEKSLQRLTFLSQRAQLENEKQAQATQLKEQTLMASLDKAEKDKQIGLQKTELKFNKKVTVFLGILALILSAAAIFVFYTQRKTAKLNKIVSEQKEQLEKLGLVKDKIFSVVSHDMRTPVNSLISFIQLLEGGRIDQEKLTKYAGQLKNTLGYTSAMMENLLNWASSQMQGFKAEKQAFDAQLCAQEVINSMQAAAHEKEISLENAIDSNITCLADTNMSALILRNLISNAIKFTPNRGKISVNARAKDGQVLISVIDNGVGLSSAQLLAFNTPGYQEANKSTVGTNKEKGTGIGLLLCKTFTILMNGSLYAESEKEKGSKFTLVLPGA